MIFRNEMSYTSYLDNGRSRGSLKKPNYQANDRKNAEVVGRNTWEESLKRRKGQLPANRKLLVIPAMRQQSPGDQTKAADEQDKHHQRVEQTRSLKIYVHVGDHSSQNKESAANRKYPSNDGAAAPEQNTHAKQHWDQRDTEAICTP